MWENKEIRLLWQLPKYTIGACRPCSSGRTLSKVIFNSFGVDRRNRGGSSDSPTPNFPFQEIDTAPFRSPFLFPCQSNFSPRVCVCVLCACRTIMCRPQRVFYWLYTCEKGEGEKLKSRARTPPCNSTVFACFQLSLENGKQVLGVRKFEFPQLNCCLIYDAR